MKAGADSLRTLTFPCKALKIRVQVKVGTAFKI